jgi:hypothetical protein
MNHDIGDIAAMRHDGDLKDYLLSLTVGGPASVKPKPAAAPVEPGYRIAHTGGWPIGTTATGPTPTHGRCTCPLCEQAAVVALPRPHQRQEGEAA